MSITPRAIQELLDELEASKQSRLRAWEGFQKIRATLSDLGNIAIAPPKRKTFEEEGAILDRILAKTLRDRNAALKSLTQAARTYVDTVMIPERKADFGSAHQAMLRALGNAEDLVQL
jgi:hypothetical protein